MNGNANSLPVGRVSPSLKAFHQKKEIILQAKIKSRKIFISEVYLTNFLSVQASRIAIDQASTQTTRRDVEIRQQLYIVDLTKG